MCVYKNKQIHYLRIFLMNLLPQTRWSNNLRNMASWSLKRLAKNRPEWRAIGEFYGLQ